MPRYVVAPHRKGTYAVLKDFRFNGRDFEEGMEFDARRHDVPRGRLDPLYRDGFIGLIDEEEDAAERERQQDAIDSWQPPQPSGAKEPDPSESQKAALQALAESHDLEPLPKGDEDFEE